MAVTVETFIESFPEFRSASVDVIKAKLAEAVLQVDAKVWEGKTDLGVKYTAAHLLALSPFGRQAKLVSKDGSTTYEQHRDDLMLQVSSGFRVI
ncbi:hypothetical protein LCGC14_0375400 [marine sediment metagenome]|uniref:Uncharacterized protein n=1 Tax=marine sediment metagenome TaxID=412755 RepID=A0A0F9WCQ8_9ZZZZ